MSYPYSYGSHEIGPIVSHGLARLGAERNDDDVLADRLHLSTTEFKLGTPITDGTSTSYNLTVTLATGALTTEGTITTSADLSVGGTTTLTGAAALNGGATVASGLTVSSGGAAITGTFSATGTATFDSAVNVTGSLTAATDTNVKGELNMGFNSEDSSYYATMTSTGGLSAVTGTFSGALTTSSVLTASSIQSNSTIAATGNISGATLTVTGQSVLNSIVNAASNPTFQVSNAGAVNAASATITGQLTSGPANVSTLETSGTITVDGGDIELNKTSGSTDGSITVQGGLTLYGKGAGDTNGEVAHTIHGSTTLTTGDLEVTAGDTTLQDTTTNALTVQGNLEAEGTATFDGHVTVTSTASSGGVGITLSNGTAGMRIAGVADPSNTLDAANKRYVDSVAAGLSTKETVRLASVAALANPVTDATLRAGSEYDGITLATGDRFLMKDNTGADAIYNGVWVIGASSVTRPADFNNVTDSTIRIAGSYVFVQAGSHADSGWVCTNDTEPTDLFTEASGNSPDTSSVNQIVFTQFSGAGHIEAGLDISKTGETLNIDPWLRSVSTLGYTTSQSHVEGSTTGTAPTPGSDRSKILHTVEYPNYSSSYRSGGMLLHSKFHQGQGSSLPRYGSSLMFGGMVANEMPGSWRIVPVQGADGTPDGDTYNYDGQMESVLHFQMFTDASVRISTTVSASGLITTNRSHRFVVGSEFMVASNVGGLVKDTLYMVSERTSSTSFKATVYNSETGVDDATTLSDTSGQTALIYSWITIGRMYK